MYFCIKFLTLETSTSFFFSFYILVKFLFTLPHLRHCQVCLALGDYLNVQAGPRGVHERLVGWSCVSSLSLQTCVLASGLSETTMRILRCMCASEGSVSPTTSTPSKQEFRLCGGFISRRDFSLVNSRSSDVRIGCLVFCFSEDGFMALESKQVFGNG